MVALRPPHPEALGEAEPRRTAFTQDQSDFIAAILKIAIDDRCEAFDLPRRFANAFERIDPAAFDRSAFLRHCVTGANPQ